MRIPRN